MLNIYYYCNIIEKTHKLEYFIVMKLRISDTTFSDTYNLFLEPIAFIRTECGMILRVNPTEGSRSWIVPTSIQENWSSVSGSDTPFLDQ